MTVQEDNSSVNVFGLGPNKSIHPVGGADIHLPALTQRVSKPKNPPVSGGFRKATWADQVDAHDVRAQTLSATDIISEADVRVKYDFASVAAKAAGEAEALRVRADKAVKDAVVLKQLADDNDIVVGDDEIILYREYSDSSLKNEPVAMPQMEFASLLASLDRLSVKQLKILFSTTTTLLGDSGATNVASIPISTQPLAVGPQCGPTPNVTSYASVVAKQQPAKSRDRSVSRVRANPTQGGVRINQKGGRIDYDNRIYTNPNGKRFRMQMPRSIPADLAKAESQMQTVVRRLKSFANTNGINKECQPVPGSDLDKTYQGLLTELYSVKAHLKDVRKASKPKDAMHP
jgi:hypothetical protein